MSSDEKMITQLLIAVLPATIRQLEVAANEAARQGDYVCWREFTDRRDLTISALEAANEKLAELPDKSLLRRFLRWVFWVKS